jgi:hypothetical protein
MGSRSTNVSGDLPTLPMTTTDVQPYQAAGWSGLAAPSLNTLLRNEDPLHVYLSFPHQLVHSRPGGRTWRVDIDDRIYYIKHVSPRYQAPGQGGWHLGKQVRWAVRPSPAMRTYRVSRIMLQRGLSVPTIVHVARKGLGWAVEELIVSQGLAGTAASTVMLAGGAPAAEHLQRVGRGVADLHGRGVVHGHLLLGHIFFDLPHHPGLAFIDNDENRLYRGPAPWRGRLRNLRQLATQVLPYYTAEWRTLFLHYFIHAAIPERQGRRILGHLLRYARARHRRRAESRPAADIVIAGNHGPLPVHPPAT